MESTMRLPLLILAWSLCAAAPQSSWADEQFGPVDGQGADPLLDAYPFFIFPNSTRIAQIVFERDNRTLPPVPMTLDVQCCTDFALGTPVRPTGVTFEAVSAIEGLPGPNAPSGHGPPQQVQQRGQPILRTNQFIPVPGVARMVGLKVTAGANANPGRYVATVTAGSPAGFSRSTAVIVNVLPPLFHTSVASCAAFTVPTGGPIDVAAGPSAVAATMLTTALVPVNSAAPVAQQFFEKKAADPSHATTSMDIGWGAGVFRQPNNAVTFTISKTNLPLTPTQSMLVFVNKTSRDKEFIPFNGSLCVPVVTVVLKSGESATLLTNNVTTTTILLRRNLSSGWENVALLKDPWTLLGGRAATFEWDASLNE
jgi:hypothetical protein